MCVCRFSLCLDRKGLYSFNVICSVCCTLSRDPHFVDYNSAQVPKNFTVTYIYKMWILAQSKYSL